MSGFKIKLLIAALGLLLIIVVGCDRNVTEVVDGGTDTCIQCHNDDTEIAAISDQWAASMHGSGATFERNYDPCSGCHTSQGFVLRVSSGATDTLDIGNPARIGCFTCHEPHTNYDFTLRTAEAVTLELGGTFDMGHGNLCVNCHQARALDPAISATTTIDNKRWGPHHGPQGDILAGTGAYVFSGASYTNSPHTTLVTNGCPTCHMADAYGDQAGGHTMSVAYEYHDEMEPHVDGCNQAGCHSSLEDFTYNGVQDSVEVLMAALRSALIVNGIIDSSDYIIVPADSTVDLSAVEAGAVLNYKMVLEDRSHGIHNTDYTFDILIAAINALP